MATEIACNDLAELARYQASGRPEAVAIAFRGRETTYGQLDKRAGQVANGLRAISSVTQTRLALLARNSDVFYEVLLGAAKARDVLLAVNWRLAPAEIAWIINDAAAEVLFVGEEFFAVVAQILPELRTIKRIIALSGSGSEWEPYEVWRDRHACTDPHLEAVADDVVLQLYTSGTTGYPKGAQITHHNLFAALAGAKDWYPCTVADVSLACMPQFHISGSLVGLIGLHVGARTLISEAAPGEILRLIPTEQVALALFAPSLLLFLLQAPGCPDLDFSSLRRIVYAGSPMPLDVLRHAVATFKCEFGQMYGLTESTGAVTLLSPNDHDPAGNRQMRSCGKPLNNAELKIVDADGAELPHGAVGEIVVRSPQVMKGYWNLPEQTAATIRHGWLHTGDVGYVDEDGYVYVHDRLKDMIISGGENVYPAEVESALFGHPAVADVAVIGIPDARWGEAVKAIVVVKPDAAVTEAELTAYCREMIAHYKTPKSIEFVEFLPRNPSGKILKRVLRAPYWDRHERQVN